jgi:hypothetical protein
MTTATPDLLRLYAESDALRLAEMVKTRQVSSLELVETAISIIDSLNPKLNAVVIETFDLARRMAAQPADGPFAGVPFLLKDIGSMWKGTRLTAGLAYREDFVCGFDSEMVRRIKAAGFVLLGRTNVPENGWCIATEPRRAHTQSLEYRRNTRWIQWRCRRRGCVAHGSPCRGIGWGRFYPCAGVLLWPGGSQTLARAYHLWSGRCRDLVR